MMHRLLILSMTFALTFLSAQACLAQSDLSLPEIDEVIDVETSDSEMELAILEAKKTLPEILKKLDAIPASWSDVTFKVEFPVTEDRSEFMWVAFVERKEATYTGILSNDPRYIDYAKFGDAVTFEKSQIADWQYLKNGKLHGHYTTRVLLDELDPEQRMQMQAILSETPE